jgi:hypothetical protein
MNPKILFSIPRFPSNLDLGSLSIAAEQAESWFWKYLAHSITLNTDSAVTFDYFRQIDKD